MVAEVALLMDFNGLEDDEQFCSDRGWVWGKIDNKIRKKCDNSISNNDTPKFIFVITNDKLFPKESN